MLYIGIDVGVNTGFAVWDKEEKKIVELSTLKIHRAMERVKYLSEHDDIEVFFEDARQRNWFGNAGREKLQGAGSVKRDSSIWDDFLKDLGVTYHAIPPKNNTTKVGKEMFNKITHWEGSSSEHSRDAAFLVLMR